MAADEPEGIAKVVRVLVDKAASFVSVLAACEQPANVRRVVQCSLLGRALRGAGFPQLSTFSA